MTTKTGSLLLCGLAVAVFTFCGCGGSESESSPSTSNETPPKNAGAHSHTEGPNKGLLAVLGSHEYHAEVLHDEDTGQVTAIISDGKFKPIENTITDVKLNLLVDGEPTPFALTPQAREAGEEVRFITVDKALCELVCEGWEGDAQVSADIDGEPYHGKLAKPDGDHEDHDEDGHDEDGHDEDGHDEDGDDHSGHDH